MRFYLLKGVKVMKKAILFVGVALFAAAASAANFCSDPIIDELGVMNPAQIEQVTRAQNLLAANSVESRVRVVADFKGNASLEALKTSAQQKCGSWKSGDGGMKNNLLLIFVAPKQQKTGFFYGDALRSKLDSKQLAIQTGMNARFRDGNIAGGIALALSDTSDLMSVKISQQGAPITINHSDNSGFAKVFGWLLAAFVVACLIWIAVWFRGGKEKRRAAQRDAQSEQGRCTTVINGFETRFAVLKARISQSPTSDKKTDLLGRLASVKSDFDDASAAYSAHNRSSNDPSTPNLSVEEYEGMSQRFAKVAKRLENVMTQMSAIESDFNRPETPKPPPPPAQSTAKSEVPGRNKFSSPAPQAHKTSPPPASQYGGGYGRSRPSQAPAPIQRSSAPSEVHHHTTVVNNTSSSNDGLLTGVILGSVMSDNHHHHHHHDDRPIAAPAPRYESARAPREPEVQEETSFGRSSSGGGSETSWGISSAGSSQESSWGGASFGESSRTTVAASPPSDCAPSDCKSSDCAPSDCRSSDCASSDCASSNCDCNCDCSSSSND